LSLVQQSLAQALIMAAAAASHRLHTSGRWAPHQQTGTKRMHMRAASTPITIAPGALLVHFKNLELVTKPGMSLHDITPSINKVGRRVGRVSGPLLLAIGTHCPHRLRVDKWVGRLCAVPTACTQEIAALGVSDGWVNVLSRHTTTAVTINENEARLMDDVRQWLLTLAPPHKPYLHNDLHLREAPPGWPGGHEAWVKQVIRGRGIGDAVSCPCSAGFYLIATP
jgi:thiamine phosphate synthase YjbQ (UPF0047 family)